MKTTDRLLAAVALALAGVACAATAASTSTRDEERLLSALHKAHPGTQFTGVSRTPIPDIYEAWMGANMALVSRRSLRYLVFGRVFDTATMTDLTAPKLAQAERLRTGLAQREGHPEQSPAIPLAQLPLADAIQTVRGDGSRSLVVFSDPACPYCKRLESELDKLDNVTIHTFLVPFQGSALPAAIWCAQDHQQAWRRYMVDGDRSMLAMDASSQSAGNCPHPLERNLALAQRMNVRGTPTLLYADGTRTDGATDAADIESRLTAARPHGPDAAGAQEVLP
ncbi:DsbC family protein [Herbaspirillum sp. HC18]|nr:DsbC family protein [Herbaspirillum sp. HC18]